MPEMFEGFLLNWLVTSLSLFVITLLPLGIESRGTGSTVVTALMFGLVNAFLGPIVRFLALPLTFLTLGFFSLIINALLFSLAAAFVKGFRINGCLSSFVGALVLSLLNMFFFWILPF
jgi:putative membrane protein